MAKKRKSRKPPERNPKTVIPGKSPEKEGKLDRYRMWRSRVTRAQELRKKWEKDYRVEECANFYLGKQRRPEDDESIVLNYFLATIKAERPNLFLHRPKMFVRPKPGKEAPVEERMAAIGEGILESIAEQDDNLENAGNLAVLQNFWRTGVLKIVYDPKFEPNPRKGEPIAAKNIVGQPLKDPNTLKPMIDPETNQPVIDPMTGRPVIDPSSGEPLWLRDEKGEIIKEPDEVVTDELYRYVWVDAKNILLPDEGPDESRWSWTGEEVVVSLEEAKDDTRFPKDLRDKLVNNESLMPTQSIKLDSENKDLKKFRYFELYDIKEKRLLAIADGQPFEDFLIDDVLPPGVEDHPYAFLRVDLITDPEPNPWPLPHTIAWIDAQKEYNISRTQITEGGKRSARKGYYTDGTFDDADEAIKMLQSPRDMEFAKVADPANPPKLIETPDINPAIYKNVALLQNEWPLLTGQSGPKLAMADADTATEASFIERAANLRDAHMQKEIIKWLAVAGRKMLQLLKATLTLENWIKIRGFSDKEFQQFIETEYGFTGAVMMFHPGIREIFRERFGREEWLKITREDLQFEATVSVIPGSTRPRNLDIERRQWMEFLKIVGAFPQLALSRELLKHTAEKFEYISERMIDELHLLARQMVDINARQAGRDQGGASSGANGNMSALMSRMGGMG